MEPNDDDVINEDGLARDPTTPEGEDATLGPVKKNYSEHFDRPSFVQQVTFQGKMLGGISFMTLKAKSNMKFVILRRPYQTSPTFINMV